MTGSPRRKTTPGMQRVIGARYKAGDSIAELMRVFSLHRSTVRRILADQGIELRPHGQRGRTFGSRILDAGKRAEMAGRYRGGASVRALAAEYHVAYGTAYNALKAAGVKFRRRGGPR